LNTEGGCSIYQVRPHKCRSHLSTDKEACNIPGNARPDPALQQAEDQLAIQAIDLYKKRAVSMNPVELGQAVLTALQDETCKSRWLDGEEVFDPLPEGISL
jgi:Fe-S-cluster containining protein